MSNISSFYFQYEMFSYYCQQEVCNIINLNISSSGILSYLFIFISGLITALNPCFLSTLPLSLSYLSIKKLEKEDRLFFILGIFTSFILLLLITHLISYRYYGILSGIPIISSVIIIILGFSFLQIINISTLSIPNLDILSLNVMNKEFVQDYLVGLFCSLTTLPCSTPIILTVLFWLAHADSFIVSMSYLLIYLIGSFMSIFILITFTYNSLSQFWVLRFWNILFPISGCIILFNGILSLLGKIYSS